MVLRLKEFNYIAPKLKVSGLRFNDVGLIVGKNAVGKSTTISKINQLFQIILQQYVISSYDNFSFNVIFCNGDYELKYEFAFNQGEVFFEYFYDNHSHIYIKRTLKEGTSFYNDKINPPSNKLAISARRDTVLYPEVESLISWAEHSYGLLFNKIDLVLRDTTSYSIMSKSEGLIPMFEKLTPKVQDEILFLMKKFDYKIEKLEVQEISSEIKVLHVQERGVRSYLWQADLSQGMQRTLLLLVYLKFLATYKSSAKSIVIDDFCEGLDYDRSLKLGKYLYEFCLENGIQLITSSNDNFLMDVVDLKYWNILQRDGEKIEAINIYNSPELFKNFEFTGLNNFDLLSSDFLARHKS